MKSRAGRPRRQPMVLAAGALSSLALALSTNGTLSAFTASITNSQNTAASGYIKMTETSGSTTCNSTDNGSIATNSGSCSTINKYGGTSTLLTPGGTASTTTVTIQNSGTVPASAFTLTAGTCTATAQTVNGGATNACSKFNVKITGGPNSTQVYSGPVTSLSSVNLLTALGQTGVAAGSSVSFTFAVTLDGTADNTYAGFQISQPLTWTFTA